MRKFYNEFFCIPKEGKIREKVMLMRVAATIITVILCLSAMSFTAYAYFSYDFTSDITTFKAANFEVDAKITVTENQNSTPVTVSKNPNASYTADLKAGKIYTVVLSKSQESTADTGFCVITALGCADTFHTQQIGADETVAGGLTDKVTFELKVTADTTVTFASHWGTSVYYADYVQNGGGGELYITNGKTGENKVVVIVNGISEAQCDAALQSQLNSNASNETNNADDNKNGDITQEDAQKENTEPSNGNTEPEAELEAEGQYETDTPN